MSAHHDDDFDAPDAPDDARHPPPASVPPPSPSLANHVVAAPLPGLFLANSVNIVGGSSHAGKTPLLAWLLGQFLDGGPVLGHALPTSYPVRHAVLCSDRSWASSTRHAFRAVVDRIAVYCPHDDMSFDVTKFRRRAERLEIFEQCLEKLQAPVSSVVWVDSLSTFTGVAPLDPDSYMVAFAVIRRILKRRGLTLIGTVPGVKPTTDMRYFRPQDRIAGSFAQLNYADTVLFLTTPEEQARKVYTLTVAPRQGPLERFDLRRTSDGGFAFSTILEEYGDILQHIPLPPATISTADLLEVLTPHPLPRSTFFAQLKELRAQGVVRLVRRGEYSKRAAS